MNFQEMLDVQYEYEEMQRELKYLEKRILNSEDSIKIKIWNTYCDIMVCTDDKIYLITEEIFDKKYKDFSVLDIIKEFYEEDFNPFDKYYTKNTHDSIISTNDIQDFLEIKEIMHLLQESEKFYNKVIQLLD